MVVFLPLSAVVKGDRGGDRSDGSGDVLRCSWQTTCRRATALEARELQGVLFCFVRLTSPVRAGVASFVTVLLLWSVYYTRF